MRKLAVVVFNVVSCCVVIAAEVDPSAALATAKSQIASKRYEAAAKTLEPAIDAAAKMTDENLQKQALTALHFYSAVAYSGMKKDDEALIHLEEALRLTPTMHSMDKSRFEPRFAKLFESVRGESGDDGGFQELYPGYPLGAEESESRLEYAHDAALEILGTREEKRKWRAADSAAAREALIAEFWADRDQTSETPQNEFRELFEGRVLFADRTFAVAGKRGSLTDRGRVFAVLGPPSLVRRRALTSAEAERVQALSRNSLDVAVGTVENWIYGRDQLPIDQAQQSVTFQFITHQGVGSFVLQKDGRSINVLSAATAATRE